MSNSQARPAWGKIDDAGAWHHLVHHCADVAAVFRALLKLPIFRRSAEVASQRPLNETDIARLSALAFLHDVGKLAPAFQAKGWPEELWKKGTRNHLDTAFFWCDEAAARSDTALNGLLGKIATWGDVDGWLSVLFAHHGRPVRPLGANTLDRFEVLEHYDWQAEERLMGQAIQEWFPAAFGAGQPLPDCPGAHHFFGGLLALADWIGSDRSAFPFEAEFSAGYWDKAQHLAESRLIEIGLDVAGRQLRGDPGFRLVSAHPKPHPVQSEIGTLPASAGLVILEAETGSGKTEAALWRFACLRAAGQVDGLYFAVPTRAAARQLHGRINAALARMFDDAPEAVLAIPGMIAAGAATAKRLPDWQVLWDDDTGAVRPSRWAAEHATRYLAAEVAVGTIDQAMLAGLMVKHAHLRGTALSRSLLVIDEVHASDFYMGQVQGELVRSHVALGGHALLMSATLGSVARARWLGQPQPEEATAAALPYPAVWVAGEVGPRAVTGTDRGKEVHITARADWSGEAAAQLAVDAAKQGGRVLVIRNTVARAQETWRAACDLAPDLVLQVAGGPALHHSRFAAEDRALLDRAVEQVLGEDAQADGCIVIGTQTLEQSLDIDADLLISDLCPMDVLLQRIGRLHRHNRRRPEGFDSALAITLCPDNLDRLTKRAENGLGAFENSASLSGVYMDVPGLAATLAQIEAEPVWRIPAMNRALVEAATHPDALDRISEERNWQSYRHRLIGTELAQLGLARNVLLDRSRAFPDAYPDEEQIKTRIGEEGAVVEIEGTPSGPFGAKISRIALSPAWSKGLKGDEKAIPSVEADALSLRIGTRKYHYGRAGLEQA